mmetsp:Transcript_16689/g.23528  ORF Transcript_16689/g.23528 Transcript_16689/m.23528 type:complete len:462 (+) Transcript_16689:297-1682(+)
MKCWISPLVVFLALLILPFGSSRISVDNSSDLDDDDEGCACQYSDDDDEATVDTSMKDDGARLAYLITIHNHRTAFDASYLFRAIRSPGTIIMIHVDTKFEWDEFMMSELHREVETCPCGAKVHMDSVYSAKWSTWSMNDPTFWGLQTATTKFRDEWDIFLNLSGDTMPVYTPSKISELFAGPLKGYNFVTSSACETGLVPTNVYLFPKHWHKRGHYTTNPDGDPQIVYVDQDGNEKVETLTIYFGSQWMALQPDFCEYLVRSLKDETSLPSKFKEYLIQAERLMTDETFIPTLLKHVYPFNETLPEVTEEGTLKTMPSLWDIRYERMDEHWPSAFGIAPTQQRYEVPESSKADNPKVWGPYFLGVYDLANIKASGALFIRKVSVEVDPNLVHMLPVSDLDELPSIQWPNELQISEKPDWEKQKREWIRQAEEERRKKEEEEEATDNNEEKSAFQTESRDL